MTKAAKHFGKEAKDFLRLASAGAYIEEMEKVGFSHLCEVTRGRYGSTWAHPKLAVFFARWLDVRFAVWCDLMVDEILRGRLEVQPVAAPVTQDRGLEDVVKAMLPVLLPEVVRMVAKIAPKDATGPRGGGITAINPQSSP